MKNIIKILLFVLCANFVYANVVFSEVMSNPLGSDTGREWIEFYNNGSEVNISGWVLNENNVDHSLSAVQGGFLISENEYFVVADNSGKFLIDYSYDGILFDSVFSLVQGGENLSIKEGNGSTVDFLFYNSTSEGYTFFNFMNGSWGEGPVNGTPGYFLELGEDVSFNDSEELTSEVVIGNVAPAVIEFNMLDEVYPSLNDENVSVNALVYDANGDDVSVNMVFEGDFELVGVTEINETLVNYTWNLLMKPYSYAGFYSVVLDLDDGINQSSFESGFDYRELMYFELSKSSLGFGSVNPGDFSNVKNVDVLNKGNIGLNVGVYAGDLSCGSGTIPASSLEVYFDSWKKLGNGLIVHNESLFPGFNSTQIFDFRFKSPFGVGADNYTGVVNIVGGAS